MTRSRTWIGPIAWFAAVFALALALGYCEMLVHPMVAHGYPAKVTRWEPTIRAAAHFYRLSAADTRWAVTNGLHIIYGESRGNTNTGHINGCFGLFQFNTSWTHHTTLAGVHYADFRRSGRGSVYRFVKVLHIGGRAAVRRHWAATIR